jgi:hypothetical protein
VYVCMYVCTYKTKHGRQDNCVLILYVCLYTLHDVCVYLCMYVCLCTNQDAAYQNHGFKRAYQPCVSVMYIHTCVCMNVV